MGLLLLSVSASRKEPSLNPRGTQLRTLGKLEARARMAHLETIQLPDRATMSSDRCSMRGTCGTVGWYEQPLPCPYDGPAVQPCSYLRMLSRHANAEVSCGYS